MNKFIEVTELDECDESKQTKYLLNVDHIVWIDVSKKNSFYGTMIKLNLRRNSIIFVKETSQEILQKIKEL